MRNRLRLLAATSLAFQLHASATAADRPPKRLPNPRDPIYEEVAKSIRGAEPRSISARLQLHEAEDRNMLDTPPVKETVRTVDGKSATVVLFNVPAVDIDFAMAFLLIDGRTLDWESCWIYNRYLCEELRLEDVDGDGFIDIAFRAKPGIYGGPRNDRLRRRPGDDRVWLAAYRITSQGLKPIFPVRDRVRPLEAVLENAHQPVQFRVVGLPASIAENEMCEFVVSATNVSQQPVDFSADLLCPEVEGGATSMTYRSDPSIRSLRPGQTVSQKIALRAGDAKGPAILRWSLEKSRVTRASEARTDALADDPGEESHAPFWYDAVDSIRPPPPPPPQPLERFPFETARP